jgi:hypothetical protein
MITYSPPLGALTNTRARTPNIERNTQNRVHNGYAKPLHLLATFGVLVRGVALLYCSKPQVAIGNQLGKPIYTGATVPSPIAPLPGSDWAPSPSGGYRTEGHVS